MNLLPIGFGLLAIGFALWHEWSWFRRTRNCTQHPGRLIAAHEEDGTTRWEIEYERDGKIERFLSEYARNSTAKVGDAAHVICDLDTGKAEHLTRSNRHVMTIGPLVLGTIFILAGVSMIYQD